MRNLKLDLFSGHVSIGELCIAPLDIKHFLLIAHSLIEAENNYSPQHRITSYACGEVKFGAYDFEAEISYKNNILEVLSLTWLNGVTEIKGWDSSFADLIHDKASLTRLVKKIVGRDADKKEDFKDSFEFDWGSIVATGVRMAMYPKIDILWDRQNT